MEDSQDESQIASLCQQLEAEYETVVRELKGLAAGTTHHNSINAHIQQICHYQRQLSQYVSHIEAAQIVTATYARVVARDLKEEHTPVEDGPDGGLWMLTYEDGFSCSWFPFFALSQEEAIAYARQLIAQLPYEVTNAKLQAYSGNSCVVL